MPDYVPAPQLPEGLAAELARQRQQNAMIIPNALQGLVQQLNQGYQQHLQMQQQRTPTSELQAAGLLGQVQPQGWQGAVPPGQAPMLPPGTQLPQSFGPHVVQALGQRSTQEASMKKALEVQGLKNIGGQSVEDLKATHAKAMEDLKATHAKELETLKAKDSANKTAGKNDVAQEKLWEGVNRAVNPVNAPRGSLLGQAGQGNARADRALTTLSSSKVTPQQVSAVVADYAGIMQGGAPHEIALRQMGYDNLATRWASLQQFITSSPQSVNTPEVVGKLRQMISEIKEVDNKIISGNLDTVEQTHSGLIQKDLAKWQKIRESVMKTTGESKIPDGRITVKDKNGNVGHIPKEQLKEALASGYSEVKE